MRLFWRLALMFVVAIAFAIPRARAVAQGSVAVSDDCFAVAMRADRSSHAGSGKSLQQAEEDAISKCRAHAKYPDNCVIVIGTAHCNIAEKQGAASDQRWIDGLRQKKISVNWESGLVAAVIHLFWIWHIVSQKTLALPANAGLGFGVPVVQAALAYVLGSDGEIGLLELPIFALPLGLGELAASVSLKRRSE
jgi:Domain of unknown function (DUF4189)